MTNEELTRWAESRETAEEVAEAIRYVAGDDETQMQRIWNDPSREEWLAVWERTTHNGLRDGNDYQWGESPLGNIYPGDVA